MGVVRARDHDRLPTPMPPVEQVIAEINAAGFVAEVDEMGLITISWALPFASKDQAKESIKGGHRMREVVNGHAKRLRAALDWQEFVLQSQTTRKDFG